MICYRDIVLRATKVYHFFNYPKFYYPNLRTFVHLVNTIYMTSVLITGALGQLGSELNRLSDQLCNVQLIYTDYKDLDITDANAVSLFMAEHKPKFIINCAAYTAVDKAESEPDKAELLNATAIKNLTEACCKNNAYLIHISTDYVFDGYGYRPYSEDDKTSPNSTYGITKVHGEQYALTYEYSMVIRTAWLYSSFGNNFVKTMFRLGGERSELGVVFDQIGTPTYAADLAATIIQIVEKIIANPATFKGGIYHYSNEGVCSWYDFARKIMQIGNRSCAVKPIEAKDYPTPAKRPHYSVLNKKKIKDVYGISIPHWEDSLISCMKILMES